jgi:CubicO group peptidase (beta-lactamase class C family)
MTGLVHLRGFYGCRLNLSSSFTEASSVPTLIRTSRGLFVFALWLFILQTAHADQVDSYIQRKMHLQRIPGLALAVVKDGKVIKAKGYGFANLEWKVPVSPTTLFQTGSVGKQFTAAGVMLLVEEVKINLEDPIRKYFPDGPETWKDIRIRHLLTHTSGIKDYESEVPVNLHENTPVEEMVRRAYKLPLNFAPGDDWRYSNTNYVILGVVIQKVTGKFYGDFLQERIFKPLEMTSTRIISDRDIIPQRAAGYEKVGSALKNQDYVAPNYNTTADGALYTTVLDMAKWDASLYTNRILKQSSLDQSWTPVKLNNGKTHDYGFGWAFGETNGHKIIEHGGAWQGFLTAISRYVNDRVTVIVLVNTNSASPSRIAHWVAGEYIPAVALPKNHMVKIPEKDLEACTGYYDFGPNGLLKLIADHGKLLASTDHEEVEFVPTSDSVFVEEDGVNRLEIVKGAGGEVTKLILGPLQQDVPRIGPLAHEVSPQPYSNSAVRARVGVVLEAFSRGGIAMAKVEGITPGFRSELPATDAPKPDMAGLRSISFIAAYDVSDRKIVRHYSKVGRVLYYRLKTEKASRYVLIYVTPDGLITDEDVVDD